MEFGKKLLADGREALVFSLTFGRARLGVGRPGAMVFNDTWWYDTPEAAVAAMNEWDGVGEPTGWMRHPMSGRRRPNGDASKEYVNP